MDEEQIETPVTEPVATLKPNQKMLQVGDRSITIDRTAKRQVSFDRAMVDDATRTITIPISSEYPVERWWGDEILSHADGAVDLSRLNDGGGFLFNHDPERYLGVSQKAFLQNRRVYAELRFDTHPEAEQIYQSVKSGILRNISIGYSIDEAIETTLVDGDLDNYNSVRECSITATKWAPFEVSIVTIPADPTVGIGRSLTNEAEPPQIQPSTPIESPIQEEQIRMEVTEKIDIEAVRQQERDRIESIRALCYGHKMPDNMAQKLVEDGSSIEMARALVLERIKERPEQQPIAQPVAALGLSDKEQREYSVCKAILAQVDPTYRDAAGFERELSNEIAKKTGRSTSGFYIPVRDLRVPWDKVQQRATYATGAAATGGVTVPTILDAASLIEFLRNRTLCMQMGARMLSGLVGNLDIPRQTGVAATYWVGEGTSVSQSEATFDKITFSPKTVGVKSRMTRLMLLQSSIDIESFVRQDIAQSISLEIDRTVINGSGSSNQPTGILVAAGTTTISLGTNGAAPTWDNLVQAETAVASINADIGSLGFMSTPQVRGKLKRTLKNSSASNSDWIWENGSDPLIGQVNGYMMGVTNQVPSNLTKGTGTNLSAIIFGNWSDVLIGEWGVLEILANQFGAGYDSGDIEVRALQTIDIQLRRAASFVKIVDAITT
jgi:HK97 family phage major capsid protein